MGVERNPKDSMKSTWRTGDRKEWTRHHWTMEVLGLHPTDLSRPVPVHAKTDPMPWVPQWQLHRWIVAHAVWPLLCQYLYIQWTGHDLHPLAAFVFYTLAFKINAVHELHMLRTLGHRYGFLDGDTHPRDQVPDHAVSKVFHALSLTATIRPLMTVFLSYTTTASSSLSLTWWLPLELGLYGIVLDFYFYWYHRAMHEVPSLWPYHRTHHLTKHPNPLLTLFADPVQEIFDIAVIPLLAYATLHYVFHLPMSFGDWWICHEYIVFVEVFGHSGLRVYSLPPSTNTWFLQWMGWELTTEDHDLHHRRGWKGRFGNYGKQTRMWDCLFGTAGERIEAVEGNVKWEERVEVPLFPILERLLKG